MFAGIGFTQGEAVSCIFKHGARNIIVAVYGDDFVVLGNRLDLDWLRDSLRKQFEIKANRIGPADDDAKTLKVLNRVVTWSDEGITIEGDQRHAELIRDSGIMS